MNRVLVLDANQRSALAVTRSLGDRGIDVITADETRETLAGSSRYSIAQYDYPSPRTSESQFIDAVSDIVHSEQIRCVLPMTELTTGLLLLHRSSLGEAVLPFADIETIDALSDKCSLLRLAASLDVPSPKTWFVEHAGSASVDLDELEYPLVLKPGKSWLKLGDEWVRNSVQYASDSAIAKEIIGTDPAFRSHPFMLQQMVAGIGQGVFAVYDKGEAIAFFAHRRIREKPPTGGVSVLSESVSIDQRLLKHAKALLDSVSWHGVAMVEFKVDESDGTPYLMEVNTRFWGTLQLAIDAGVDFPWILHQIAVGETAPRIDDYRKGVRLRWLLGDIDNLYLTLRDRNYSFSGKLRAVLGFLTPSPLKTKHEVNRWSDLGPFWFELRDYLRNLMR